MSNRRLQEAHSRLEERAQYRVVDILLSSRKLYVVYICSPSVISGEFETLEQNTELSETVLKAGLSVAPG
jgi:hypothetical protein